MPRYHCADISHGVADKPDKVIADLARLKALLDTNDTRFPGMAVVG